MSKDSVDSFYECLGQDVGIQQEYADAIARGSLEAAAAFATAHGFDLSPEDLSERLQARSNELSDDQLEKVAGGTGIQRPTLDGVSSTGLASARIQKTQVISGDVLGGLLDIEGLRRP